MKTGLSILVVACCLSVSVMGQMKIENGEGNILVGNYGDEKKKIRSLVTGMCANYDRESGLCLPLDCACYMLHKCWTGAYCRYFREAVLPLNPELQASLTTEGISPELRACAVCGKAFLPEGRQAYCSDVCKAEGNRRKSRERMRKMREKRPGGCYDLPPPKA